MAVGWRVGLVGRPACRVVTRRELWDWHVKAAVVPRKQLREQQPLGQDPHGCTLLPLLRRGGAMDEIIDRPAALMQIGLETLAQVRWHARIRQLALNDRLQLFASVERGLPDLIIAAHRNID